ncbi:MAG: integrase core domain-containing protein [Alphaproteobacteria bacterium]|nr:integrase core domain-containing protein [Alphaproteobacteria bacterium]
MVRAVVGGGLTKTQAARRFSTIPKTVAKCVTRFRELGTDCPATNGKAERFIQSSLREWAYASAFETSDQRRDEPPRRLHHYNWHRPPC